MFDFCCWRSASNGVKCFVDTVSGEIDYTGKMSDHNGVASFSWGDNKMIKLTEKFSMTDGLTYDAELTNPWTETIIIGVSHTGNLESWTNSATYAVGSEAPITVYSEFDSTKYIKGKVIHRIIASLWP